MKIETESKQNPSDHDQTQESMEALAVIYGQLEGIEKEHQLRIIQAVATLLDIKL